MSSRAPRKDRPNANEFASRIRQVRLQRVLAQSDVARAVGVTETQYGRYERGQSDPTADVLKRIAEALGTSTDYLLQGGEVQPRVDSSFADSSFRQAFQEAEKLPEEDRVVILKLLDAFLCKRRIHEMTRG